MYAVHQSGRCFEGIVLSRISESNKGASMSKIGPGNIIPAAVITHFAVLAIVLIGTLTRPRISEEDRIWDRTRQFSKKGPIFEFLAGTAIVSFLIFGVTDVYSALWVPLLRDVQFSGIPSGTTLYWVWLFDIFLLGILVLYTGGSRTSPFTPLFFVFPTLAIFLHESGSRLIQYTALVAFLFTVSIKSKEEDPPSKLSFWFVSVLSFLLTVATGFFTRP
jgi:hypothetical protein